MASDHAKAGTDPHQGESKKERLRQTPDKGKVLGLLCWDHDGRSEGEGTVKDADKMVLAPGAGCAMRKKQNREREETGMEG